MQRFFPVLFAVTLMVGGYTSGHGPVGILGLAATVLAGLWFAMPYIEAAERLEQGHAAAGQH